MDNDDNKEENNNNKDVKLNMNVIKEDNNDDDDDDKVSFVSFLPPNKNRNSSNNNNNSNSKDNKDTDKVINQKKFMVLKSTQRMVNYKIYYTIPSSKSAANFDIIDFVDVEILYDELNIKEDDFITQQFSVTFWLKSIVKEAETNPEIEVKKVLPRKTSGNPVETSGFSIPKNMIINGKLRCPLSIESSGRIPVTFGDDIVSECTLPIDVSINSDYAEISKKILEIHEKNFK
ncbi:hypothetical protein LY90DRAFT_517335 [Neocallimastix californiae]|uniref:Uncharacterized protein n=1 Tax=Neocallimastix californiae TaxID=1754190 RepID=A0A1Y2A9A8_9FUNG|nr:hypothetical protein LY90DRAFT_517335 [Neocallimastix californiae]|eukprot:ORY19109.1 hypothetical protein LY90DRAFT_517335 [Neocallimastix californiae]